MSQDLQEFASYIEQLKSVVSRPDFNKILDDVAHDLPKEKRFLIKMEVKRLAKPCMRAIDLRGQVDGDCQPYEYAGISHYLDSVAQRVFEEQVGIFGLYSFGVYEKVMNTENNFRVIREKAEAAGVEDYNPSNPTAKKPVVNKFEVEYVRLLDYVTRQQERMNYSIAVEAQISDSQFIRGTSIDISAGGLRLKTEQDITLPADHQVIVHFRGLEEEYSLDRNKGVYYRLVKVSREDKMTYVTLKRDLDFPDVGFDRFLENLIHGYKRRYKVNLTNTLEAIVNKSAEQYFSSTQPSLPIFIKPTDQGHVPAHMLLNQTNKHIYDYWLDENGDQRLGYLLARNRLEKLLKTGPEHTEMYIYSFSHIQHEKVFFYSATDEELSLYPTVRNVFLGYAARQESWRTFKIKILPVSGSDAIAPLSIPDDIKASKKLDTIISPRLESKLNELKYVLYVYDVTSDTQQEVYSSIEFPREELARLKVYAHPRTTTPPRISFNRFNQQDHRIEARYLLTTDVVLTTKDDRLTGHTEDVSIHGLKVHLSTPAVINLTGQKASIVLPKLQQKKRFGSQENFMYKIVGATPDGKTLHLKAMVGKDGKAARSFFESLIRLNKDKLDKSDLPEEVDGLGKALRCMTAKNSGSSALILSKDGPRYLPNIGIQGIRDNNFNRLSSHGCEEKRFNFEYLYRDRSADKPFIQAAFREVKVENHAVKDVLYVALNPKKSEKKMAVIPFFEKRFSNNAMRASFVTDAIERGQFIALQLTVNVTGKPEMDMIQTELNYVSMYAMHKAKEYEDKIWDAAGIIHFVDVTETVLRTFKVPEDAIEKNLQSLKETKRIPLN